MIPRYLRCLWIVPESTPLWPGATSDHVVVFRIRTSPDTVPHQDQKSRMHAVLTAILATQVPHKNLLNDDWHIMQPLTDLAEPTALFQKLQDTGLLLARFPSAQRTLCGGVVLIAGLLWLRYCQIKTSDDRVELIYH